MDLILSPFMWIISWVMYGIHAGLVALGMSGGSGPAWVLSIVGLTIVVRLVVLPLYNKQIRAGRATQIMQPEMRKIQKKYKGRRDTVSMQRQQEEMKALYRKYGASPMASCWPMLVQMPILFSLYRVLYNFPAIQAGTHKPIGPISASVAEDFLNSTLFGAPMSSSIRTASSFAAEGHSAGSIRLVAAVLVVIMCVSMFITQKQLLTKNMPIRQGDDDNPMLRMQKFMLYGMPLIYIFSGLAFPVGVLVYWSAGNLWNMAQQAWFIRHNPTPGSKAYHDRQRRLAEKRRRKGLSEEEIAELEAEEAKGGQRYQPMSKERAKKAGVEDRFNPGNEADDDDLDDDAPVIGKDGLTDEERARKRYQRQQAQRARAKAKRKKKGKK